MTQSDQYMIVGQIIMAMLPVYILLQIWFGFAWHGRWRAVALSPLILAVPLALYGALAFYEGANLWPLLLIYFAPIGGFYLLGAALVRWVATRHAG